MTMNEFVSYTIALIAGVVACMFGYQLMKRDEENKKLRNMLYNKELKNFILIQKIRNENVKEEDKREPGTRH